MTHLHVDTETAARKRQEIGLSPRRATARKMVIRPPEGTPGRSRTQQWLLLGALGVVMLLSLGFAGTRVLGGSTGAAAVELPGITGRTTLVFTGDVTIKDEFVDDNGPLVRDFQPDRWSMGVVAEEGIYRIRVLPGVLAWSTLGAGATDAYRFSTSVMIPTETPWGYGGIIGRSSPGGNLYLVQVDGQGRLRVQVYDEGKATTMQEWIAIPELQPAGSYNHLLVQDTGKVITVFANGVPVFGTESIYLPAGDVGVFGATTTGTVAEANYDWVQLEPLAAD
jgi:hypothetical protein